MRAALQGTPGFHEVRHLPPGQGPMRSGSAWGLQMAERSSEMLATPCHGPNSLAVTQVPEPDAGWE